MNWYLIHSKPHQEKIATENLRRLGVETLFPELVQTKFVRKKKRTIISPLFPGYLFCRFDWCLNYRKVNYAHGVVNVVKFGSAPALVEDDTIRFIQARMQEGYMVQSMSFRQGQGVRIEGGPFHGLEAVFEMELSGTQRVALLLKSVAYHARIIIDRDQVING